LAGLAIGAGFSPAQHVFAVSVASLVSVALVLPRLMPARAAEPSGPAAAFVKPTAALVGLGVLAFFALLSEGAMADWSAVFLHESVGTSRALAAAGFAACSFGMAGGRFAGDRLIRRFGSESVLRASGTIAAAGLAAALIIATPMVAIAGCALLGLGLANPIPGLFTRAGPRPGTDPGPALSAVATTGYLGFLAGPPLIGLAAELTSLRCALAIVALCCGLIAYCAPIVRDRAGPRRALARTRTEPDTCAERT